MMEEIRITTSIGRHHVGVITFYPDTGGRTLEILGPAKEQDYICLWSFKQWNKDTDPLDKAIEDLRKFLNDNTN